MTFRVAVRRIIGTGYAKDPKSTAIIAMEMSLAELIRRAVKDAGGTAIVTLCGTHIAETLRPSPTKSAVCIDAYITKITPLLCPLHDACEMHHDEEIETAVEVQSHEPGDIER